MCDQYDDCTRYQPRSEMRYNNKRKAAQEASIDLAKLLPGMDLLRSIVAKR